MHENIGLVDAAGKQTKRRLAYDAAIVAARGKNRHCSHNRSAGMIPWNGVRHKFVTCGIKHLIDVVVGIQHHRTTISRGQQGRIHPVALVGQAVVAVFAVLVRVAAYEEMTDRGTVPTEEVLVAPRVGRQELKVKLDARRRLAHIARIDVLRSVRLEIRIIRPGSGNHQRANNHDSQFPAQETGISNSFIRFHSFAGSFNAASIANLLAFRKPHE